MEEVEVTFDDEGNPKITTRGFAGAACKRATKDLERSLGRVLKDTPTAEMNKPATLKVKA